MRFLKIKPLKIGLALGGGAARGIAHIGVLKAFEEKNFEISALSGTSMGAIVASLYAFKVPLPQILKTIKEINWTGWGVLSDFKISKWGLFSNDQIGHLIQERIGDVNIEDAAIPLAIVTTDISSGEKITLYTGSLIKAVRASTAVPGLFSPENYKHRILVDGGLVENVPVSPLREMGAQIIYAVNLNAEKYYGNPQGIFDIISNSFDITIDNTTRIQLKKGAHFVIDLNLRKYDRTSTEKAKELCEYGHYQAIQTLTKSSPYRYYLIKSKLINFINFFFFNK